MTCAATKRLRHTTDKEKSSLYTWMNIVQKQMTDSKNDKLLLNVTWKNCMWLTVVHTCISSLHIAEKHVIFFLFCWWKWPVHNKNNEPCHHQNQMHTQTTSVAASSHSLHFNVNSKHDNITQQRSVESWSAYIIYNEVCDMFTWAQWPSVVGGVCILDAN